MRPLVALSSTVAEYMALTEDVKEVIWLKGMLQEFGMKQDIMEVFCDNQKAIHLSKNKMFHEKTKHIDIKVHFV